MAGLVLMMSPLIRGQRTEDRGQRTEDRRQKTEDSQVTARARRLKTTKTTVILATGIKSQRSEIRSQRSVNRTVRRPDDRERRTEDSQVTAQGA